MNCLGFQLYYLIRHGGIGFNICLGEGLCLCHWIFTGAVEVKILSLSSSLFIRLDFRATTMGNCKNWHQSINYRKVLFVARLEGMCVHVCVCLCFFLHVTVCVSAREHWQDWCSSCLCNPFPTARGLKTHIFGEGLDVTTLHFCGRRVFMYTWELYLHTNGQGFDSCAAFVSFEKCQNEAKLTV